MRACLIRLWYMILFGTFIIAQLFSFVNSFFKKQEMREDNILPYRHYIKELPNLVGTGVLDCPKNLKNKTASHLSRSSWAERRDVGKVGWCDWNRRKVFKENFRRAKLSSSRTIFDGLVKNSEGVARPRPRDLVRRLDALDLSGGYTASSPTRRAFV